MGAIAAPHAVSGLVGKFMCSSWWVVSNNSCELSVSWLCRVVVVSCCVLRCLSLLFFVFIYMVAHPVVV